MKQRAKNIEQAGGAGITPSQVTKVTMDFLGDPHGESLSQRNPYRTRQYSVAHAQSYFQGKIILVTMWHNICTSERR